MKKFNVYSANSESVIEAENATIALEKRATELELKTEAFKEYNDGMQCLIGENGSNGWTNFYATNAGD